MTAALDAISETIREHVLIDAVVGEVTTLIPDGDGTLIGACPFGGDGEAGQLIVRPSAGMWHCPRHGTGDVITFTERHRKMTRQEAVIHLYGRLHDDAEPAAETTPDL